ncbi:MAG TPA: YfhO family protein [Bryobacteraceae bacterium]|nr:YfhO family protein [Bryobacteraceae bacterium]
MRFPKVYPRWPYPLLLLETVLFFRRILFEPRLFVIPWDLRYYHLPIAEFMAKSLRQGYLPLWDPFTYCGWPIYAELTTQLFYPPTLIAVLISNALGGRDLLYILELQLVGHVFLAGVCAYLLARRLGAAPMFAVIGATVYQLGPYFASQTQHIGAIDAGAWLPLSWLAVLHLAESRSRRWMAALAFSLGMSILCGFPAVTAVAFITCVLLAAGLLLFRLGSWRNLLGLVPAFLLAAALAGIQALPTVQLNRLSVSKYRSDWLGDGGGHPVQSLVSMILPNYWGIFRFGKVPYRLPWNPTFLYLYFGLLALVFILAVLFRPKVRYVLPLSGLTLCCLLWMLGEHTPVGLTVFRMLPYAIKLPLYAEYVLPAFSLGMAMLAGLGAHSILSGKPRFIGIAAVVICALDLILVSSSRPLNTMTFDDEPGISYDHFDSYPEIPVKMRELVNQTSPPSRIDTMNGSMNWAEGMLFEVPTATGNDPLALERMIQVRLLFSQGERWGRYYQVTNLESPALDLVNVRYVLSQAPIGAAVLEKAKFRQVAELPGNLVYENTEAQPRFFLVSRIRKVQGLLESVAAVRSPDFDGRREAAVESAGQMPSVFPDSPGGGRIRVLRYAPLEVELEVDSPVAAYLVTSDANYPGWRAAIDGKPAALYTTNIAFRGLPVPAGRSHVSMRFAPSILWQGAAVTLAACLALGWLMFGNPPHDFRATHKSHT